MATPGHTVVPGSFGIFKVDLLLKQHVFMHIHLFHKYTLHFNNTRIYFINVIIYLLHWIGFLLKG